MQNVFNLKIVIGWGDLWGGENRRDLCVKLVEGNDFCGAQGFDGKLPISSTPSFFVALLHYFFLLARILLTWS